MKKKLEKLSLPMKASLAFICANILEKGIGFITIPLFTRMLSENSFGQVSVYNSWYGILNILITFSFVGGVINNAMQDFKDDKDGFISSLLSLVLLSSLFFYCFYLIFLSEINNILKLDTKLVSFMFLGFAFNSSYGIWMIKERFYYNYKKVIPLSLCIAIFSPILSWSLIKYTELPDFLGKIYGDGLILLIINIIIFIYSLIKGKKIIEIKYWKYALSFNLPLIPHYLSYIVLGQSDRIMIARYIGNDKAGIYSLAYTFSTIINIVIGAINSSFIPWTYKQMSEKKYHIIGENALKLSFLGGIMSLCFIFLGPEFIRIIAPPSYYEAIYIIPPVVLGTYYTFIFTFFGNIEFYHKKTNYVMYASVMCAVLNIILNIVCIPRYGYIAAGYTTMISYFFMIVIHYKFMINIEKNKIYDIRKIMSLVFVVTVIGLGSLSIYNYKYLRIFIVLLILFSLFLKRKHILKIVKIGG